MSLKQAIKVGCGGSIAVLVVAACSGQFGLCTPPIFLLGPPLLVGLLR